MEFIWIPGQGVDTNSLARMRNHFSQPASPMGEAWFMGVERRMFVELLDANIETIDYWVLSEPLQEIACGICNFGDLDEWRQWLLYLQPRCLQIEHHSFSTDIRELLVTSTFGLYPNQICPLPYSEYRTDLLLTLGRTMMNPERWQGLLINPSCLLHHLPTANDRYPWWSEAHPELSASLMLHLKYLEPAEILPWLQSVFAIPDVFWRSQLLVWFIGSERLLSVEDPIQPSDEHLTSPKVDWSWSHLLNGEYEREKGEKITAPLIPFENRMAFWNSTGQLITQDWLQEWRAGALNVPHLIDQTSLTVRSNSAVLEIIKRQLETV